MTAATTASRPSTALNFFSPDIGTTGESYKVASIYSKFDVSDFAQTRLTFRGRINSAGSFGDIMTLRGGNVGIGTVSPSEKLDL